MNIYTKLFASLMLFLIMSLAYAQDQKFTRADTLRGSITPERGWWDLNFYHLDIQVFPEKKYIIGLIQYVIKF